MHFFVLIFDFFVICQAFDNNGHIIWFLEARFFVFSVWFYFEYVASTNFQLQIFGPNLRCTLLQIFSCIWTSHEFTGVNNIGKNYILMCSPSYIGNHVKLESTWLKLSFYLATCDGSTLSNSSSIALFKWLYVQSSHFVPYKMKPLLHACIFLFL